MAVDVRWMALFADVPADRFDAAMHYWQHVTGWRRGDSAGEQDEFVPLVPTDADAYVWLQRTDAGSPGWHLDLYTPDLGAAVRTAAELGARLVEQDDDLAVFSTPAGQPFCLAVETADARRPVDTSGAPPGQRSLLDQICLDIPSAAFEREVDFWSGLTGWRQWRGELPEFANLDVSSELPLKVLLQRLGADDGGGARAHADFGSDGRAREAFRHAQQGASVGRVTQGWTTMHDPAGLQYCVTDHRPKH